MNIRLTKEQKIRILNADDTFKVMQQILLRENKIRRNQEHFWIIGLNDVHKILFIELLSLGAKNMVIIEPSEVFRMAVYKGATTTILVHNHPSGKLSPSEQDKTFTGVMINASKSIKIDVFDHLIINETGFYSFLSTRLMDEVRSIADVTLNEEQAIKMKQLLDQSEQKGMRQANLEFAKRLIETGLIPLSKIRELAGLSIREMNKLTKKSN